MSITRKLLATLCLVTFPALASEWFKGENLLTSFEPTPEEWIAYEKSEGNFKSLMWKRKGSELNDMYAVSVTRKYKRKMAQFRELQDKPGRESCETFVSDTLDETKTNGYSRLSWVTTCTKPNGFTASILQVAIQGRDSFYHVQRIWRQPVAEPDMLKWKELIADVSVCDTRRSDQPCPDNYVRAK